MISFTSKQRYYFCSSPMDMRKDIDTFFLPIFDEKRSCYKICWSDFVALTEGVQVTKMIIKEDIA